MTCTPTPKRSDLPPTAQAPMPLVAVRRTTRLGAFLTWLRRDTFFAQLLRFALVGGSSSLVYALLFSALQGLGAQPANMIALVLSSVLANDLHRRLTFHAEQRLSWLTAQWQGGGVSLISLVATTLALGWLEQVNAHAGLLLELALVGAVFAIIGGLRFLALRWLFLLRRPNRA